MSTQVLGRFFYGCLAAAEIEVRGERGAFPRVVDLYLVDAGVLLGRVGICGAPMPRIWSAYPGRSWYNRETLAMLAEAVATRVSPPSSPGDSAAVETAGEGGSRLAPRLASGEVPCGGGAS
ncbi:hypothetical protein Afil01_31510 [Actinorhabdospora filicis]|uniref:Uncharacterized protein n=1 Tax=Actinorhabdospora filicis TaxID=1785913 RepID=A0A9W6SJT3_9ACTN|nr:hypothetical protein Afil01_31510 [Actinorhabdospora filicis]